MRISAAKALGKLGLPALPTLMELAKDKDAVARSAAENALTQIRREAHR